MAVSIRLSRGGAKKRPYYRIVVADSRSARDGKYLEQIGTYNPLLAKDDENRVKLDGDRAKHWLSVGAQPSDRVARFLDAAGVRERAARNNPKKGEPGENAKERLEERAAKATAAEEAAAAAAAAPAPAPVEEAPVEDAAPAEEAAPAEAESDATGSVKTDETAEAVADAVADETPADATTGDAAAMAEQSAAGGPVADGAPAQDAPADEAPAEEAAAEAPAEEAQAEEAPAVEEPAADDKTEA